MQVLLFFQRLTTLAQKGANQYKRKICFWFNSFLHAKYYDANFLNNPLSLVRLHNRLLSDQWKTFYSNMNYPNNTIVSSISVTCWYLSKRKLQMQPTKGTAMM